MKLRVKSIRWILVILAIGVAMPSMAATLELPERVTPRPATTDGVPHVQIDVEMKPELRDELLERVSGIPHVEIRDTVISLPGARGFWIAEELPLVHPEVIVGGREFAHIHPDGSLHASLRPETARAAVEAGWAVPHPWANQRPGWEGFVMIYSPLSADDLNIVFKLVLESYSFVTGRALN